MAAGRDLFGLEGAGAARWFLERDGVAVGHYWCSELSKALCEDQTAVVQRYLDGVEKALLSYGWATDIVGPSDRKSVV